MAAVSDHSALSEESDKELKKIQPGKLEILEPQKPDCEEALSVESEKKIDEPTVKEIKTDEEPKAVETDAVAATPTAEETAEPSAQKIDDDKQVQIPLIKEETKTKDTANIQGEKETVPESETTNTECKSEDKRETISAPEKDESTLETIVEPLEQAGVTELTFKEAVAVDPVNDVEVETGNDKVEDSMLSGAAKVETIVVEIPEVELLVKGFEHSPSGDVSVETKAETIIDPTKNEVETAEKCLQADKSSTASEGETEKSAESRRELDSENEKKQETVASCENNTTAQVDDKAQQEATTTKVQVTEVEKTPGTEEEKKEDEPVKADAQDSECTKDYEETQTIQDIPKEDVPVKTQKQSNNIIKMVKHSLGKAKKAIIGKSQNSKAPSASDTKDVLTK